MGATGNELFEFGKVVGTHGLKGDLKVRSHTPGSAALLEADRVFLRDSSGQVVSCEPVRMSPHKGNILLRLAGFDQVETASQLVGSEVLMQLSELPELDEDENYWYQLQGMSVSDRARGDIGRIEKMFTTAAHDVYVVQGRFGEVLIPAVEAFVLEVDTDREQMLVDLPEGLVPEPDED